MNVPQVEARALAGERVRGWTDAEGYLPALREAIDGAQTIAFDDESRAAFLLDVLSIAPHASLRGSGSILRGLRLRKTSEELAWLREAGKQVDQTIAQAIAFCQPGRTEAAVDADLRAALLQRGDAIAFTIIAGGPNGALPHHETAHRPMQRGDVVVLDFGTRLSVPIPDARNPAAPPERSRQFGYHSDITVTCSIGEPADPEARKVYRVVWEAQQAALAAVRPGATCGQIDHAARSVIEAAGYGPNFLHRTGHGLGLQIHEPPYLMPRSNEVLEQGMVFSIEPGVYLPGRFGVRLEVIAAVGKNGAELVNQPSAEEILATDEHR
jgi:Xaa-Pro dipeptidase